MSLTSMLDRVRECYCYRGGWSSGDVGRWVWRRTAASGTINGLVRPKRVVNLFLAGLSTRARSLVGRKEPAIERHQVRESEKRPASWTAA